MNRSPLRPLKIAMTLMTVKPRKINGMKIDNPAASKELLEAFTNADALQGKIRKPDGSIVEVSIDAEELQSMMGGSE